MSKLDEKHVITGNAIVIWDGITRPDSSKPPAVVHSLKVAIAPGSPELAELEALVQAALVADPKFGGIMPPGGLRPFMVAGTDKPSPDPTVGGYTMINSKTRTGAPTVHDVNGKVLSPMEYGAMLYPGAVVRIIVHAYAYDTAGNKGVAFGIDGIQIVDATAPRLAISAGVDTAAAFGGATQTAPTATPPVAPATAPPVPPAAPAMDYLTPHTMTAKANGIPYQQYKDQGWTDEVLIAQGYMLP